MSSYSSKPGATSRTGSSSPSGPFSQLGAPSSSKPASRSLSPSNPQCVAAAQNGSDAFSSLLGARFSNQSNQENLSLAARRAASQKEHEAKLARDREGKQAESAAWSGLDFLGQKTLNAPLVNAGSENLSSSDFNDDWLFEKPRDERPSNSRASGSLKPTESADDWGLAEFSSNKQNSSGAQTKSHSQDSLLLLDALDDGDLVPVSFGAPAPAAAQHSDDDDDDILGVLGKPVSSKPPSPPKQATPARSEQKARGPSSSPPHIIGQIVEMGFSPQQARLALASTDTGLDVQQALETLLSNGVGAEKETQSVTDRSRRGLAEFRDKDDVLEEQRTDRQCTRSPMHPRTSSNASNHSQMQSQTLITPEIQERADKLLAQASEIGLNVFNRANALWKDGKEKMQKAYLERAAKNGPIKDGRPRWMTGIPSEANGRTRQELADNTDIHVSWRDDEGIREELPPPEGNQKGFRQGPEADWRHVCAAQSRIANLPDDEAIQYVSPARRRPPNRNASQGAPPSPLPRESLRVRKAVSASPSELSSSTARVIKGTELYKLGQYANAEQEYSAAIDALPDNHLLLIPLYNNRALARIRIGEHSGAIEDCTSALSIIGSNYHPAREAKVTREEEGASVNLADAYLKALRRRAEAYEGREKWYLALKDWERIIACDWTPKLRDEAFTGTSRCRKMLSPENDVSSRKPAAPRPTVRAAVPDNLQDFEAVKKLRQANQLQEEEEQTKANLKDSVDARLNAWKAGRETNVRALVASLETVLWSELGWQKVGLHELVTPAQVKVRYMRAIAKLHPDKINSGSATIEQRMIANGVFAALNDAWTAFKQ